MNLAWWSSLYRAWYIFDVFSRILTQFQRKYDDKHYFQTFSVFRWIVFNFFCYRCFEIDITRIWFNRNSPAIRIIPVASPQMKSPRYKMKYSIWNSKSFYEELVYKKHGVKVEFEFWPTYRTGVISSTKDVTFTENLEYKPVSSVVDVSPILNGYPPELVPNTDLCFCTLSDSNPLFRGKTKNYDKFEKSRIAVFFGLKRIFRSSNVLTFRITSCSLSILNWFLALQVYLSVSRRPIVLQ